jgi:precorrin-6B methylase 2
MTHAFATGRAAVLLALLVAGAVSTVASGVPQNEFRSDVIYYPTPQGVVDAMLKLARVTSADVVYDLGSGDGRIPVTAARAYGARAVGIDIDPRRIQESRANATAAGVADKATFINQDLFTADIREATVVTLYLLPELNTKLLPKFNRELKPGTRVVSHAFEMRDLDGYEFQPEQKLAIGRATTIYLWTIPFVRK